MNRFRQQLDRVVGFILAHGSVSDKLAAQEVVGHIEKLEAALGEIREIYAGMEGFEPETAPEGYQQRIIEQMWHAAREAFNALRDDLGVNAARQLTSKAPGMTLRDYHAAKALEGICASGPAFDWTNTRIAQEAYDLADAMMEARK